MHLRTACLMITIATTCLPLRAQTDDDARAEVGHYQQANFFHRPASLEEWKEYRAGLHRQMRASLGLWPEPERCDLTPRIFGRKEFPGYSVEKVQLQTLPGFWLAANLYRPAELKAKNPAIVCPHGHWGGGRMQMDVAVARSVNFARQGYVVLAYDMIGFGDTRQIAHNAGSATDELWGLTVSQLQTWNSIRALDFVLSLPDVDAEHVACTGASGGGTQTFILTALDERVKVSAPVNMISSHFQGGCICENPPYLRLDTYNLEIAAMAAPRPLLMVSCTGDWGANTPWVEFPLVQSIYALYGAAPHVEFYYQDSGHNYNALSREAVYRFFDRWMMQHNPSRKIADEPVEPLTADDLKIGPKEMPEHMPDAETLKRDWRTSLAERLAAPKDAVSLRVYRESFGAAYPYVLSASQPAADTLVEWGAEVRDDERTFYLGRREANDRVPVRCIAGRPGKGCLVWLDAGGHDGLDAALCDSSSVVARARAAGLAIVAPEVWNTGQNVIDRNRQGYFTTYNRTDTTHRVQDILTCVAWANEDTGKAQFAGPVHLAGTGEAGPWVLLAQGLASHRGMTIADANGLDSADDEAFLAHLFIPGLRRVGDFQTAAALTAPNYLVLLNAKDSPLARTYREIYAAAGQPDRLVQCDAASVSFDDAEGP